SAVRASSESIQPKLARNDTLAPRRIMSDATIVPRWEWRTFADDFGAVDAVFDELTPERVEEGDELYLLSRLGEASVKVRGGLMDVKQLDAVDEAGLEQWRPVMKAAFPISAGDVRFVLDALRVEVPELGRQLYSLEELVADVVDPHRDLLAVQV